jgi:hypothetical protein
MQGFRSTQNPDGGWPYRKGSSWTEPTVYAVLAHLADDRALTWLRAAQRRDGGWSPRPSVALSTWVTSMVALLPPESLGEERHAQAVRWLVKNSGMETTPGWRLKKLIETGHLPGAHAPSGWCWIPGTSAWVTPTCFGILALDKCMRRRPSPELRERIETARAFLLLRRCSAGGWNHGSQKALGVDADPYPETTGQALLALRGTDPAILQSSFVAARRMLQDCRPPAGAAWLRLGLMAHGQQPAGTQSSPLPCRTFPDAALLSIAEAAERGTNVFLD